MTSTENAQHRLVILGSMHEFVDLVKRAHERGIYTIVCDGYENGPAKHIPETDAVHTANIRDFDEIARICQEEQADGIIASYSDLLAECYSNIAQRAGLDPYLTPDKIVYLRDKSLMKAMFDEIGVPYPKTAQVRKDTLAQDVAGLTFPCVTKPANAWGSHGVYVVTSVEDVAERFDDIAQYSSEDYIFLEEYNDGFEFNMMNWVCQGKPVVLSIADREKSFEVPDELPQVSRIVYPSRLTDTVMAQAVDILQRVVDYLGYEYGPLCMQFFYSPERGIQVCECAGRIFGYEHELLELSSNGSLSTEDLLIDQVYDKKALAAKLAAHDPHLPTVAAGLYFHGHDGVVAKVEGFPQEDPEGGIVEVIQYAQVGAKVSHAVGDLPYFTRIYLAADSYDKVDTLTDDAFANAYAENTEGQSMLRPSQRTVYKG